MSRRAMLLVTLLAKAPGAEAVVDAADLRRARRSKPGRTFRGDEYGSMTAALNAALQRDSGLRTRPCHEHSLQELHSVQRQLSGHLSLELRALYEAGDGRRLDVDELDASLADRADLAATADSLHDILRDATCHDVVMWWVHHVPSAAKPSLRSDVTLPLLPTGVRASEHGAEQSANLSRALGIHAKATACLGCHLNSAWPDTGDEDPQSSLDPAPRPWPLQFEMTTNITGHTFGARLVQATEYRYQHMQAQYTTIDTAEEVSQNCTVLFEKDSIWEWYDDKDGVIKCAKLFDVVGIPPRDWFAADHMTFDAYRNYTNPLGETALCATWCDASGFFCYAQENATGIPWVHPHKTGFSWFEHVTPIENELREPFRRPASCPPLDSAPKFAGSFDGSDDSITATVACQRAWFEAPVAV